MKTNFSFKFYLFNSRALIAFAFSSASVLLAMLAFAANPRSETTASVSSSLAHSRFSERAIAPKTPNEAPTTNGSWSIVPSPNSGSFSNLLNNVTCTSPSECWAVGSYVSNENPEMRLTLIEHWDGASWTIFSAPNPDTSYAELWGVTCTSASQCWAVGEYTTSNSALTLIERWDGESWTIVSSPSPGQLNFLTGVTCTSPSDCWAVGFTDSGTLTERWDGTSWAVVSSPSPGANAALYDVTCTSASQCYAVGYYYSNNGSAQTLIEQWNGTAWTIAPSPNTSTTQNNFLYGLACTSASQCWAVGYYQDASSVSQTLVERWDGVSWTIVSSPNRASDNLLLDVACLSPSQCWAVGLSGLSNGQTLVEEWDGASWTIASSSNVNGAQFHQLRGVTCSQISQCWAVGEYQNQGSPYQTLIERAQPAFFSGEVSLGNGVYYLQFPNGTPFGYYSYLTDPRWIYHFDMGYEYWFDANDGNGGIYFYDSASTHFFYTSPSFPFPYLYDFTLNTVLYYFPDPQRPGHYTSNPRYFYNFATGQIITM